MKNTFSRTDLAIVIAGALGICIGIALGMTGILHLSSAVILCAVAASALVLALTIKNYKHPGACSCRRCSNKPLR